MHEWRARTGTHGVPPTVACSPVYSQLTWFIHMIQVSASSTLTPDTSTCCLDCKEVSEGIRFTLSDLKSMLKMQVDTFLQEAPIGFDDVAVYFSAEEWDCIGIGQRLLYMEVMLENYCTLLSLGLIQKTPNIILRIKENQEMYNSTTSTAVRPVKIKEEPLCVPVNKQPGKSRTVVESLIPRDSPLSDEGRLAIIKKEEQATEVQEGLEVTAAELGSKDSDPDNSPSDAEEREVQDPDWGTSSNASSRRCPSFSDAECNALVMKVLEHKHKLYGQSVTYQEKMDMWTRVALEVSQVGSHCRTVDQCKNKFRVCRNSTKKKMEKTEKAHKGRGRPTKKTVWELMIREQLESVPTPEKTQQKRGVLEDFEDTRVASATGKRKKPATQSHDEGRREEPQRQHRQKKQQDIPSEEEATYEDMPALEGEEVEKAEDILSLEVDVIGTPLEHQERKLRRTPEEPEVQQTAEQGTQTITSTATATTQTDSTMESRIDHLTHLAELQARHQEETNNSLSCVINLLRTQADVLQNLNMMWTTQSQATVSSEASAAALQQILEELRRIQSRAPEEPQPDKTS